MATESLEDVKAILRVFWDEGHDYLYWAVRESGIQFYVSCNDCFAWGCADCEPVHVESLGVWSKAYSDLESLDLEVWAPQLYAARMRKMRPQGAFYELLPESIWHLFDECGPEREVGFGNPSPHP